MGRMFWILIGLLGAVLVALVLNHDSGTLFGVTTGQFAGFSVTALWAAFIAGAVFRRGMPMGQTMKQMALWILIILSLMTVYIFRYDLQDFGSRLTGGLLPGSPISRVAEGGAKEVTLIRSRNGHFEVDGEVNGKSVRFLVDTGATGILLTADAARGAGINLDQLSFTIPTSTANGTSMVASARIDVLDIGSIRRRNVGVLVSSPGLVDKSLLGQRFLESLHSYERRGDRLFLRD